MEKQPSWEDDFDALLGELLDVCRNKYDGEVMSLIEKQVDLRGSLIKKKVKRRLRRETVRIKRRYDDVRSSNK